MERTQHSIHPGRTGHPSLLQPHHTTICQRYDHCQGREGAFYARSDEALLQDEKNGNATPICNQS